MHGLAGSAGRGVPAATVSRSGSGRHPPPRAGLHHNDQKPEQPSAGYFFRFFDFRDFCGLCEFCGFCGVTGATSAPPKRVSRKSSVGAATNIDE